MRIDLTLSLQGYYRRASANMALGKFKLALKDFEAVKKVRPRDKDAITKYTACNKVVRQMAFERAIAVESSQKKPSETIDIDTMSEGGVCVCVHVHSCVCMCVHSCVDLIGCPWLIAYTGKPRPHGVH